MTLSMPKGQKSKVKAIIFWLSVLLLTPCSLLFTFWWFQGWNGTDPLNVVISSDTRLFVLAIRPKERKAVEVEISPQTMITVLNHGTWQARALWELSKLTSDSQVLGSVGWDLLEVPVDSSLRITDWRGVKTSLVAFRTEELKAIADIPQIIRVIWFVRGLKEHQFEHIDLSGVSKARLIVDPSGEELVLVDSELIAPLVSQWFEVSEFRQSGLAVAVRNATGTLGAGNRLGRQLEHSGLRVVAVASKEGNQAVVVKSKELMKHPIVKKIATWLKLPITLGDFDERADILIVL